LLSSNQVKHINSLKQKKFREIHRQFIAEGSKLVKEIIESQYKVLNVYAIADWLKQNENILLSDQVSFVEVSLGEMERITALSSPSPALAVAEIPEMTSLPAFMNDLVLALDDIRDPGNLGTIIRIADWFGIKTIICSENTVDLYNPKVIQATMGSAFRINIFYADLKEFLASLSPEVKVYGTFSQGENIYSAPLDQQGIIIIGNESSGISNEISLKVTDRISIPAYITADPHPNHAESLNASIATAIICSEFRRRMG
jgi:RNA methyltransferase, TrmH family